tara:strand:+ start:2341 stop:3084 length:744 start_codon:yes stop_codon:yes gene_type:complete
VNKFFLNKKLHFDSLNSTNETLKQLSKKIELQNGFYITADYQKSGKCQNHDKWDSNPKENLLISIFLNLDLNIKNSFMLNQLASLSILDTLSKFLEQKIEIKWPNDVYVDNKKISGILINNIVKGGIINSSVIGIGINVNQTNFNKKYIATSMKLLSKKDFELNEIEKMLMKNIKKQSMILLEKKISLLSSRYNNHLYGKNLDSLFILNKKRIYAKVIGVNQNGKIKLMFGDSEVNEFSQNEVKLLR